MEKIGKRIRIIRELAGVRQNELARKIDVSSNYISLVENEKKEPSLKFIRKVSDEFGVPASVFLWNDINLDTILDTDLRRIAEDMNELFWRLIKERLSVKLKG